nr:phage tail protein [Xenorhabdus griffiniae]
RIGLNIFGQLGIRIFGSLRIGLNIFGQLGIRIFGSLQISLSIFAQLGIRVFGSLRISLSIFGQLGVRVFSYLGSSLNILGSVGGKVFGFLRNSLNTLFSSGNKSGIFVGLRKGIGKLGNIGQKVFGFLGNGINILASVGVKGLSFLSSAFSVLGKAMLFIGRAMMANPILAIISVIAMAAIYIWQNWETLGPKFAALWESIKNICSNAWQGIKNLVSAAWEGIKSYFMNGGLIGLIYQNWDTIKQSTAEAWESVKQNTLEIWESVKKSVSDKWNEIVADVQAIPEKLKAAGSEMIDSLLIGIQEKWENLKSKFASITDWFKSWWSGDDKQEVTVKTSQDITKSDTSQQAKQITQHDKGGFIPAGKLGLVGEYGPEIINGPANVTSRKNTAKLAALGLAVSSMSLPIAAQDAPLHAQSLPAYAYEEVQAKWERSQPQQYSGAAPQYNIYVYGAQGQSAQDIARVVRQELEQRERMHQARMRSSLSDRGEDFS